MKYFLFCFLTLILFSACQKETKAPSELFSFIPPNTAIILKSDNLKELAETLNKNELIHTNQASPIYKRFHEQFKSLKHIKTFGKSLLCLNKVGRKQVAITILTEKEIEINLDSIKDKKVETFNYDSKEIKKFTLEANETFSTQLNNIYVYSSSKLVLENIIRIYENQLPQDPTLEKIYSAASKKHAVFIHQEEFNEIYDILFPNGNNNYLKNFSDWTVLDLDINKDEIHLNGVSSATIQDNRTLNLFQNIKPQTNELAAVVPNSALGYVAFTYDSFENLKSNLTDYRAKELAPLQNESFFNSIQEVGEVYFSDQTQAIILNSIDANISTEALLAYQDISSEFRGVSIYNFPDKENIFEAYQPLIKQKELTYYTVLDHYFIFAKQLKTLENIIASYQNRTVLENSEAFQNTKDELSDESSLLLVTINENFKKNLANRVEDNLKEPLLNLKVNDFKIGALQFIYDNNFAHVNAVMQKSKANHSPQQISQINSIKLPANLATRPQFVKNWKTKQMEIAAQDESNLLFVYKNNGELHWKKQLDSRIVGDIQQIDIYNNGRLQLIFATQNQIYILDRNGNQVNPFPLKFNNTITQELSVFDYDHNSDYRFVLTQNNQMSMLNKEGKKVNGFKFSTTDSELLQSPKHIRIGRKDYILVNEMNGTLHILNRTGDIRVPAKKDFNFSKNKWYLYKNLFTTTNINGELIQINESGKITTKDLKLTENHNFLANNTTLISFDENELIINGKKAHLDYGLYTSPQLIETNNKTYIAITDTQTSKVYLFNNNANLIEGFPVYGNSKVSIANMDNRGKLELCVKGEENSVLIYQLN
ncbi:hypothetical protein [Mesonia aestuariivivens]|uniref:Uncharacterized protein n=1 Tax=Mesonia aestuariivivens TaxID=2796128 RepID=A0ABS6W598_9FLAO|nr:hypothetical protein [Mesonia aestuariivivens]MBW2963020.1 hypothetical protein [Mesonia aestuariivivens]